MSKDKYLSPEMVALVNKVKTHRAVGGSVDAKKRGGRADGGDVNDAMARKKGGECHGGMVKRSMGGKTGKR